MIHYHLKLLSLFPSPNGKWHTKFSPICNHFRVKIQLLSCYASRAIDSIEEIFNAKLQNVLRANNYSANESASFTTYTLWNGSPFYYYLIIWHCVSCMIDWTARIWGSQKLFILSGSVKKCRHPNFQLHVSGKVNVAIYRD